MKVKQNWKRSFAKFYTNTKKQVVSEKCTFFLKLLKVYFPGIPVIWNCGTVTEKFSECLIRHLKPVMQDGQSYFKGTYDFLNKINNINALPENVILTVADVVGLYPSKAQWSKMVWRHWKRHWIKVKHINYLRVNLLNWQNFYWKTTTFNI